MKKEWTIFAGLLTIFLLANFLNFTEYPAGRHGSGLLFRGDLK